MDEDKPKNSNSVVARMLGISNERFDELVKIIYENPYHADGTDGFIRAVVRDASLAEEEKMIICFMVGKLIQFNADEQRSNEKAQFAGSVGFATGAILGQLGIAGQGVPGGVPDGMPTAQAEKQPEKSKLPDDVSYLYG